MQLQTKQASKDALNSANSKIFWLGGSLGLLLVAMLAAFGYVYFQNKALTEYLGYLSEQKLLSQIMLSRSLEISKGQSDAFPELAAAANQYQTYLNFIKNGNPANDLPPLQAKYKVELQNLIRNWDEYKANIDVILSRQERIEAISEHFAAIFAVLPELDKLSEQVALAISSMSVNNQTLYVATRQTLYLERVQKNLNRILSGSDEMMKAAGQFGRDFSFYADTIDQLLANSESWADDGVADDLRGWLEESREIYNSVQGDVLAVADISTDLLAVQDAAITIDVLTPEMLQFNSALEKSLSQEGDFNVNIALGGLIAFICAIILLIIMTSVLVRDARRRTEESLNANRRNQDAILRLLDEMVALGDGDLTSYATVSEDITGAIADSVNFSIDALRSLVTAINKTVKRVSTASTDAQATADSLQLASQRQTTEIETTTKTIKSVAEAMESISDQANESANVAFQSVEIANKGAGTVRKNIESMDTIRDTIQETSKRIKRLGESSQQIGEIVGLINEIADRTNILALNAAIQASAAGESGRGFAVVADEVQRLAERASGATKQISALVDTIQNDTTEAIQSMEQTTSGVVSGTELSENAGKALAEIENVSKRLADLIQQISVDAQNQARLAVQASKSMHVIQDITRETAAGTEKTTTSISNLTDLANDLNTAIAGFKLPDLGEDIVTETEDSDEVVDMTDEESVDELDTAADKY